MTFLLNMKTHKRLCEEEIMTRCFLNGFPLCTVWYSSHLFTQLPTRILTDLSQSPGHAMLLESQTLPVTFTVMPKPNPSFPARGFGSEDSLS